MSLPISWFVASRIADNARSAELIFTVATDKSSVEALRCQADGGALVERNDDNETVVARRLAAYSRETLPVVEYYRKREARLGLYRRIDGNLSPVEIANEVSNLVIYADTALAA